MPTYTAQARELVREKAVVEGEKAVAAAAGDALVREMESAASTWREKLETAKTAHLLELERYEKEAMREAERAREAAARESEAQRTLFDKEMDMLRQEVRKVNSTDFTRQPAATQDKESWCSPGSRP
jgi:hypothetical protein